MADVLISMIATAIVARRAELNPLSAWLLVTLAGLSSWLSARLFRR